MNAVNRFPLPDLANLPEDVQSYIRKTEEKAGFIPNAFLMLARRPAEFRAFLAYYDAVTQREGSVLSKVDVEMITVLISGLNGCRYCTTAHGALLRVYSKQPELPEQLASDYLQAPVSDAQKAMLTFAVKLARTPEAMSSEDYQPLYDCGFDDEAIWDIAGVVGFFGFANRMAVIQGVVANPEFETLGK